MARQLLLVGILLPSAALVASLSPGELALGANAMKSTWMNYTYVSSGRNLCNSATNICRSLGHWVFTVAPKSVLSSVVPGAAFLIDADPWVPAGRGNFEAHFVNGQCATTSDAGTCVYYDDNRTAQVWNVGFDWIQQGTADTLKLPSNICVKVWMAVSATGEVGVTEQAICTPFVTTTFSAPAAPVEEKWVPDMMYSQSADAVTFLCEGDVCRSDGHISLDVQVPDPTHELIAITEYSIDGSKWTSAKTNTFFEQKVKYQNNKWYHTISWNYDDVVKKPAAPPQEVCFKMAVQSQNTLKTWQVDFGEYASKGDKHMRCLKFCDFVMPFSHAVSAGGYCPSTTIVI